MSRFELCYDENSHVIDADGYLQSADVSYLIFDHENETDVLDYARTVIPNKITFRDRSVDLDNIEIMERRAQDVWKVTAHYPANKDNYTDQQSQEIPEFSFDISAGTKHITHSKETVFSAAAEPGETAPDYGGAINVNQDNKIDGVDIVNSVFSFSEKHYFSNSKMDNTFKRQIASLVGTVNDSTFKQWEAGELLFMGATGSRRGKTSKDKWEVTFRFAVSMNASNIEVGDITVPSKNGWDYLWVKYANDVNDNMLTKKIEAVYVERVYDYESFNPLK
jgi:hypothetical protein